MKLSQLLHGIPLLSEYHDLDVADIKNDSRAVNPGDLYFAIRGSVSDGHAYLPDAIKRGAAYVVTERDTGFENQILVKDTRKAYALACANFFGNPSQSLRQIGVTGTNGKTSTTSIIKAVLEKAGQKTGLIGTIQIEYGDVVKENPNTTPDAYLFQKTLREMADAGCEYVVSEISSHALAQQRVYGNRFEVCVFTNLTREHLDYHRDMEDYYQAKKTLFSMGDTHVVNIHDEYGRRLSEEIPGKVLRFSVDDDSADFYAADIVCKTDAMLFRVVHDNVMTKVRFAIPGMYSVENALAAIAACSALGISMEHIVTALGDITCIKGRSEIIYTNDTFMVICDYAHAPDGIENILKSLRQVTAGRLVALFGCGGDRDRGKRPLMAKACEAHADFVIVTSDNPRSEDPDAIIDEILPGFSQHAKYHRCTDRTEAIRYAMEHALPGDMIVLLGKGHETYQELATGKIDYDERQVVASIAADLFGDK